MVKHVWTNFWNNVFYEKEREGKFRWETDVPLLTSLFDKSIKFDKDRRNKLGLATAILFIQALFICACLMIVLGFLLALFTCPVVIGTPTVLFLLWIWFFKRKEKKETTGDNFVKK